MYADAYQEYFWNGLSYQEELQGRNEWDIQLTKRQNVPVTTVINTAANTILEV